MWNLLHKAVENLFLWMYYIRKYGKNQFSKIEKLIWNRLKRVSLWHREKEGIKGFGDIPQQAKIDWKSLMRKRGLSQFFVSAYALTVLAKKCNLWSEYQANFKFVFWLYHKDSTIFTSDLTNIEFQFIIKYIFNIDAERGVLWHKY